MRIVERFKYYLSQIDSNAELGGLNRFESQDNFINLDTLVNIDSQSCFNITNPIFKELFAYVVKQYKEEKEK